VLKIKPMQLDTGILIRFSKIIKTTIKLIL